MSVQEINEEVAEMQKHLGKIEGALGNIHSEYVEEKIPHTAGMEFLSARPYLRDLKKHIEQGRVLAQLGN